MCAICTEIMHELWPKPKTILRHQINMRSILKQYKKHRDSRFNK